MKQDSAVALHISLLKMFSEVDFVGLFRLNNKTFKRGTLFCFLFEVERRDLWIAQLAAHLS